MLWLILIKIIKKQAHFVLLFLMATLQYYVSSQNTPCTICDNKNVIQAATIKCTRYFSFFFFLQNIILKLQIVHLTESSAEGDTLPQQIFTYIY